jgi:DNA invertase Pin-like site-specific DNA recombinase
MHMTVIGYARVSSTDQDLQVQEEALRAVGCKVIRSEKRSGTAMKGRDQLQTVLDFIHDEDVLVVTKLDRLALMFPVKSEGVIIRPALGGEQ